MISMKQDLHQLVTDRLVAAIEAGTRPWACGWSRGGGCGALPIRANGEPYRGINVLLLWAAAVERGYASSRWMTFNQAKELGGSVRKGEKSTQIVFFKKLDIEQVNDEGDEVSKSIAMMRAYNVFNVDQIDGLPARFLPAPVAIVAGKARDEAAEAALRSSGAAIAEDGGDRAYYDIAGDAIHLPAFDRFASTGCYLATLAHELVHWTGAKHRLDRFGHNDKAAYAFEELVAEIGAAFACARLEVAGEHIDNHAAYLASWLKVLKGDKRAIFRAASLAQTAVDMVLAGAGRGERARPAAQGAQGAQLALAI